VLTLYFSFFFFGGLSIHLSKALLAYLFSYNIQWGATKKEVERSNFFIEVPRILKRFRVAFLISFTFGIGCIILSTPLVPVEWRFDIVGSWGIILPLALTCTLHILFPVCSFFLSFSLELVAYIHLSDHPEPLVDDLLVLSVSYPFPLPLTRTVLSLLFGHYRSHRRCTLTRPHPRHPAA
jgi:hypothetical protein